MKKKNKKLEPPVPDYEAAARHLASTAPERQKFRQLLEREATALSAEDLMKAAEDGVVGYYSTRKAFVKSTMEQLSRTLRLALAICSDTKRLETFYNHAFWDHRRPNKEKLTLSCLKFAMPPDGSSDQKLLSKYASAINWLVLQGYTPDNLAQGVKREGGLNESARKLAAWRRDRTKARADRAAAAAKKPAEGAGLAPADVTPSAAGFPVRLVRGLRQKIKDREPPADRPYLWARLHHHGNRITIIRIAKGRSSLPPKTRKRLKKAR
jgi:hypothetical protein